MTNTNNFLLSIIIPSYNSEKYIQRCLDSIFNQKEIFKFEVIVIDDGSQDKSPQILDKIASINSSLHVVHQPNNGPSYSRNKGVRLSKGQWIWFIDADDEITSNSFEELQTYLINQNLEAITIRELNISNSQQTPTTLYKCGIGKIISGKERLIYGAYSYVLHDTLYRKSFLINNDLQLKNGILHEDVEFIPRAFYKLTNVIYLDKILYYKYFVPTSIINSINYKKNFDLIDVAMSLDEFEKQNVDYKYKHIFHHIISLALNSSLHNNHLIPLKFQSQFNAKLQANRNLFHHFLRSRNLKYIIEGIIFTIFPTKTKWIYNLLNRPYRSLFKNYNI